MRRLLHKKSRWHGGQYAAILDSGSGARGERFHGASGIQSRHRTYNPATHRWELDEQPTWETAAHLYDILSFEYQTVVIKAPTP